jgi:hypothetical protein
VQLKPTKKMYPIVVEFQNGLTRTVKVRAASRDKAEARAMKFNPSAVRIKRDAL